MTLSTTGATYIRPARASISGVVNPAIGKYYKSHGPSSRVRHSTKTEATYHILLESEYG